MFHGSALRLLVLIWLSLWLPLAAGAQETDANADSAAEISQETEDDKGFITRFLEEKLSGAGRQVVIDGFRGALSSRATFERMTIADDQGIWITLENGAMQWHRAALLRGRVNIDELSAERVILPRLPAGGEASAATPEVREFSLPQLPVGLHIANLDIARVELGQPVIGQEAVISVTGAMNLEGGEGDTNLTIDRVDGPRGRFGLITAFSNETRVLQLDLQLDEAANGLFANAVKMNGRPAVKAEIQGNGPLSDFVADIGLETDGQPRVAGKVEVNSEARDGIEGTAFRADLSGDLSPMIAPDRQEFFEGQSVIRANGWRGSDGRLAIPELTVSTGALDLQGNVETNAQGAPQKAQLTLLLGRDAGATVLPVRVPFGQTETTVNSGNIELDYDVAQGAGWQLTGRLGDLVRPDLSLSEVRLDGSGRVVLTPEQALQEVRGWVAFGVDDVVPSDPGLAQALGDTLNGGVNFAFSPGNALDLWGMNINADEFRLQGDLDVSGLRTGLALSGDVTAQHLNIATLSTLAERDLAGKANAQIKGRYVLLSKAFDVQASVEGTDLSVGQEQADRMLAGASRIELDAKRDSSGIELRRLQVDAQNLTAQAQGFVSSWASDVTARVTMPDLAVADPDFAGGLEAEVKLTGAARQRMVNVTGEASDLVLGIPEVDGLFKGQTALNIDLLQVNGAYELQRFTLSNPQLEAEGSGRFSQSELDGRLKLTMPDLAVLGRGFSGGFTAEGTASQVGSARKIDLVGQSTDLRFGQQDVDGALSGVTDLRLRAEQNGEEITVQQFDLTNQQVTASAAGRIAPSGTDLTGKVDVKSLATFGRGWRGALAAKGSFKDDGTGARRLDVTGTGRDLSFGQTQLDGALAGETALAVTGVERDGTFTIETARVENASLNLTAEGRLGAGTTDLRADLSASDLRFLGQGFRGAVELSGTVRDEADGGRAISARGTARGLGIGDPRVDSLLAGQTSFDLAASQNADGSLTVSRLQAENGQLRISGDGSPATGLNLDARLNDLGLLVAGFPGPATVAGTVRNTGAGYQVNLDATAPGETRATITGTAAGDGSTMDLRVEGSSNAAAANPFLRTRSIEGPLSFDIRMNGAPSLEALSGRVQLSNGRLAEPRFGLAVDALNATAALDRGRINVDINGQVEAGGTISVSGPITLTGQRPMDLTVRLADVVLRDPSLYETRATGTIRIGGSQAAGPLVQGRIDLGRTEFRIPSTGLGGARSIPDMTHLNERPPQRQTRAKAGLIEFPSDASRAVGMSAPPATPPAIPARFDLTISAPDQVFVRGRGVDAELGGEIRLTGNARQPIPVGALELIRGRVDLLGKRFDLTEGLVEMQGSLIPVIRLVAESEQDEMTARIIIDGDLRDPEITFESSPEMPEEEVLSQLLFGRGLDNISGLQAAQLASAIATLAGAGGDGIVSRLRQSTGLDDLDLTTDDEGRVSVRAGKYLSENLYTDIQVGDEGKTKLNLNLDMTKSLTARGSVASDGESTLGLFYERDY
ncbi:translocation/assembly module TamB domain-containing protein [Paracoccus ravus]|uniref:translocation/assembly module TamB domain-containing protein n=1 Tax=Paracoccus ravus TaxID=2447760 RepID=UPI00106EF76E|nr:translocation/assembly module TamB domain-containing protein [Paracoccus ravus]